MTRREVCSAVHYHQLMYSKYKFFNSDAQSVLKPIIDNRLQSVDTKQPSIGCTWLKINIFQWFSGFDLSSIPSPRNNRFSDGIPDSISWYSVRNTRYSDIQKCLNHPSVHGSQPGLLNRIVISKSKTAQRWLCSFIAWKYSIKMIVDWFDTTKHRRTRISNATVTFNIEHLHIYTIIKKLYLRTVCACL
jgi:hypothetical protein